MKSIVDKIKGALAAKDQGAFLAHYLLSKGQIMATNGRITAGGPLAYDIEALVPGAELEALVGRLGDDLEATILPNALQLRQGRMHGTIETLAPDTVAFLKPEDAWMKPPNGFIRALGIAQPFIAEHSTQQYALAACLRTGAILASNNVSLIEVDCIGLISETDILLPCFAVDFILSVKADLIGMSLNSNHACFLWADGVWLRTQLYEGNFPPVATKLLTESAPATVAVAKEWNKAYEAVASISENSISIYPDKIVGGAGKSRVEFEIDMGVASPVHFNPKFLNNVIGRATHWLPELYPAPIPFRGEGFHGLIMGRKA